MIKRKAFKLVVDTMENKQIPILMGLRRTGKTTILKQIKSEYENSQIINFDNLYLLSFSDVEIMDYLNGIISSGINVLLLDEIQERENWDKILKNLFDQYVDFNKIKVVATGSSSITFAKKDTGVDRTKKIILETLDFNEYAELSKKKKTFENFEKFLGYGGFPGHVGKKYDFEKMLDETLKPILKDDLPSTRKGINSISLIKLIKELALLTNGEVNVLSLERKTGITRVTLNKYIDILDDSLLLKKVYQVDKRGAFGKKRMFKIFLNPHFHLWLLNKEFNGLDSKFKGHIIESYWLHWAKSINGYHKEFFYLKDADGKEIDFVSFNPSGNPTFKTLHELKYTSNVNKSELKQLSTTPSINKLVWCKETKKEDQIKYISILDINNN